MFLVRVCRALTDAGARYCIVGGHAVALQGAVRGTVDVDLVLRLRQADFERAEAALKGIGLVPRLPVTATEMFNFREEYVAKRNLRAWSFWNPHDLSEIVDILITEDLDKLKADTFTVGGQVIYVLSRKDLIAMKKRAGRAQDLSDVAALERLERRK